MGTIRQLETDMRPLAPLAALAAVLTATSVHAGPVSKFDDDRPDIDVVSQVPIHDIERCLLDIDGQPAPQVYAQPDRPGFVRLLWIIRWEAMNRADLETTPEGTRVRVWKANSQLRSCTEIGRKG